MIEPEIYKEPYGYRAVIKIDNLHTYHGIGPTQEIARERCIDRYEKGENKGGEK